MFAICKSKCAVVLEVDNNLLHWSGIAINDDVKKVKIKNVQEIKSEQIIFDQSKLTITF